MARDPRTRLTDAAAGYRDTKAAHEGARAEIEAAIVDALRQGVPPMEVVKLVEDSGGFGGRQVRRIAREHGIEPGQPFGRQRPTGTP
jgi:hypothetical protein